MVWREYFENGFWVMFLTLSDFFEENGLNELFIKIRIFYILKIWEIIL